MPIRLSCAAVLWGIAPLSSAFADDWVAARLRGQVLQLVGDQWQPLSRGDVVTDDRVVRTLKNGRVEFQRGEESVSLGPETQIQIHDKTGQRFTTVTQYFGEVAVEAKVQNVQHFAVRTPMLVAVVKGTEFVVTAGRGWAKVDVQRGHVAVESETTHSSTVIANGQSATATATAELSVQGKGDLPPVVGANGKIISDNGKSIADPKSAAELAKNLAKAAAKATGEEKKALEQAAKEAEKVAKDSAKAADKAEKAAEQDAQKAEKDAKNATEKAEKEAAKDHKKSESKDDKKSDSGDKGGGDKGNGKK